LYTNLRIGDMSNLILNQTEARSWFLVTNSLKRLDYISIV